MTFKYIVSLVSLFGYLPLAQSETFSSTIEAEYQDRLQEGLFDSYYASKENIPEGSQEHMKQAEEERDEDLRAILEVFPNEPVSEHVRGLLAFSSDPKKAEALQELTQLRLKPVKEASSAEEAKVIEIEDAHYCKVVLVNLAYVDGKIDQKTQAEQIASLREEKSAQLKELLKSLKDKTLKEKLQRALKAEADHKDFAPHYKALVALGQGEVAPANPCESQVAAVMHAFLSKTSS